MAQDWMMRSSRMSTRLGEAVALALLLALFEPTMILSGKETKKKRPRTMLLDTGTVRVEVTMREDGRAGIGDLLGTADMDLMRVFLVIENLSASPVAIKVDKFYIEDSDRVVYPSLNPAAAASARWTATRGQKATEDDLRRAWAAEYERDALPAMEIPPGKKVQGQIYFRTPDEKKKLCYLHLVDLLPRPLMYVFKNGKSGWEAYP